MPQLTPERMLKRAAIEILNHDAYKAMAGVFMVGTKRVEHDARKCPTARTDGVNEVYGAAFLEGMSPENVRFLMIHECKHKLRRDLRIHQHLAKIDRTLANNAMDFVINSEIIETHRGDGFAKMDGPLSIGCYDPKYAGWTTVQVFNDLRKQAKQGGSGGQPSGEGFDDHGWDEAEGMTPEEAEEVQRQIDTAIRQGAIAAGKLGQQLPRDMADLLTPPINWREVLREFITETCAGSDYSTWRRPNRRFISAGLYLPSGISEKVETILCGADMSGSIGVREQSVILGAIADMSTTVKPSGLDMVYWDTKVAAHEHYDADDVERFAQSTNPRGGGGTDVNCVPGFMREQMLTPQCAIILTDGHLYNGWGEWPCPVLWVIIDNPSAVPTTGTAVHVKAADL